MYSDTMDMLWDGRIRTSEQRDQNPLPYHLATPHLYCYWTLILIKNNIGIKCSSIPAQLSIENLSSLFFFIEYIIDSCQDFDMCISRIQLNLLIITYNSIKILYVRYDSFYSHLRIEGFLIEGVQRKRKILRPTFPSFFIFPLYQ